MEYNSNITVYAKIDNNRITAIDSSIFVRDPTGWLELDRSDSGSRDSRDAYAHASGNYFSGDLTNPDQTHRYIYDPDCSPAYREATAEELEQERAEIEAERVPVGPTAQQLTQQMITDLELQGIEQGQAITDLELQALELGQTQTDFELRGGNANVV